MIFSEKLQILRKNKGYTQEALADKFGVSRQAVAKWESGQIYPDISNLILISEIMNVSVDYLVKDNDCAVNLKSHPDTDLDELIAFRLEANVNTYAAFMNEVDSTRPASHDFRYENGRYMYHDTYVGGEEFAGEEAIWKDLKAVYAMNYMGRVLSDGFSGNFLKEALRRADKKMPYRGPQLYQAGEYTYRCKVTGDFTWFQGLEEIYQGDIKVYECVFHGGSLR
ncbi:MAG: helix-turn-helix transcriptional regulator [Lachnospiraceae bacterium]|nr:helix-turn-helix transcriptional regulator [Lachnospiraceae bacterium]